MVVVRIGETKIADLQYISTILVEGTNGISTGRCISHCSDIEGYRITRSAQIHTTVAGAAGILYTKTDCGVGITERIGHRHIA